MPLTYSVTTAIIVDPQRDIHQYLVDTGKFGLEIRHVFLTHFHADFVAGRTPRGNGEQPLGYTFGTPRQSSTRP
jgi:ribonuclease BN (tRNA processing enzyme)